MVLNNSAKQLLLICQEELSLSKIRSKKKDMIAIFCYLNLRIKNVFVRQKCNTKCGILSVKRADNNSSHSCIHTSLLQLRGKVTMSPLLESEPYDLP